MLNEKLHNELTAFLKANYHEFDEETKCFFDEAYTDYEDRVSDKDLGKVLDSDDPEQAFEEMLWNCYTDCEWQYRDDIVSEFLKTPEGSKYNYEEVDDELVEYGTLKYLKIITSNRKSMSISSLILAIRITIIRSMRFIRIITVVKTMKSTIKHRLYGLRKRRVIRKSSCKITLQTVKINSMLKGFWKPFIKRLLTARHLVQHYSFPSR